VIAQRSQLSLRVRVNFGPATVDRELSRGFLPYRLASSPLWVAAEITRLGIIVWTGQIGARIVLVPDPECEGEVMKRIALIILAMLAASSVASAGSYATPAQQRYVPYSAQLPACDDTGVLARISDRFAQKEAGYWNSSLQIGGYDRIREIGLRANGLAYIPRRYCVARVELNDQHPRAVIYSIAEDLGIIGWDFGVEWCVIGLDRNLAYAPECSAARPFLDRELTEWAVRARY
jgi:hypothetical protein